MASTPASPPVGLYASLNLRISAEAPPHSCRSSSAFLPNRFHFFFCSSSPSSSYRYGGMPSGASPSSR